MTTVDDFGSGASLNNLSVATAEKIEELDKDVDKKKAFLNNLSASAQWTARLYWKFHSSGQTKVVWSENTYFNVNILRFQGAG